MPLFSDPVSGKDFFGRQSILNTLTKRVNAFGKGYRQNIAVVGHPQLGKTSLLHHFLSNLDSPVIYPIYVDLTRLPFDQFCDSFASHLLYGFLKKRQDDISPQESLDDLIVRARPYIPETVEWVCGIGDSVRQKQYKQAATMLFELTTIFHRETGYKTLVVIDEFHLLQDHNIKSLLQILSKRIMVQKETMYIMASSAIAVSNDILNKKLSLLFGRFEKILIEPFKYEVAERFLKNRLQPAIIDDELSKFLIYFTDGHPFYINVICNKMKELVDRNLSPNVDTKLIVESFKDLLFNSEGILNQHFSHAIHEESLRLSHKRALLILIQIAKGKAKLKDIASGVKLSSQEVSKYLKVFVASEFLAKNGVFYYFPNQVLRFWLSFVCGNREKSLLIRHSAKEKQFISDCLSQINLFIEESKKDVNQRIQELFERFSNEVVEIDDKGKKMPHFREIQHIDSNAIVATASSAEWVCQIENQKATEDTIKKFNRMTSAKKSKAPKKVLITLQGMNGNARLLAKNSNVWTLSLRNVNTLMNFYGKTKIVK